MKRGALCRRQRERVLLSCSVLAPMRAGRATELCRALAELVPITAEPGTEAYPEPGKGSPFV